VEDELVGEYELCSAYSEIISDGPLLLNKRLRDYDRRIISKEAVAQCFHTFGLSDEAFVIGYGGT
jgi:hypothetical protein